MRGHRWLLSLTAAALAAGALAACGDDDESATADPEPDIRLELTFTGPGGEVTRTLECDPAGGTWPAAEEACDNLAAAANLLEPFRIETRDYVLITEVPLTVTGVAGGEDVDLTFPERGSSTRRARLRALRQALVPSAYDAVAAEAAGDEP